jgi:hypothetical protein
MSQKFILHKSDPRRLTVLANAQRFIGQLPEAQAWEIEIRRHVKKRSDKQRRALFGAAYGALMEFCGLEGAKEKEHLHRDMCGEYFGWRKDALGRPTPVRTTTKNERGEHDEISVDEALRFYAFLQRKGAEVGCWVPDPDPFWRENERSAE